MNKNIPNLIKRSFLLAAFVFVAAWLIHVAQNYSAVPYSFIPPMMCTMSALVFLFTGAALFGKSSEADE
jgi:hypothetical protein